MKSSSRWQGHGMRVAAVCLAVWASGAALAGEGPDVRFDVEPSISCRVLPPTPESGPPPGRIWLELQLNVSTFLQEGAAPSLLAFQLEFLGGEQVVDFSPRTELTSEYAGAIAVERRREQGARAGGGGAIGLPFLASGHLDLGGDQKNSHTVRYELAAPKEATVAAGAWGRGRGVYFKFRSSSQNSLEGALPLRVVCEAPAGWRAGRIVLCCRAESTRRNLFREETVASGAADFLIPLHRAGDRQALELARGLVAAENSLRRAAVAERRQRREESAGLAAELSSLWKPKSAAEPVDWARRLIFRPATELDPLSLPPQLREPAEHYLAARSRFLELQPMR